MRRACLGFIVVSSFFTSIAVAADARDEAVKNDRWLIEGVWRVVALDVDGQKSAPEDARKLSVVNGSDGTWSLRNESSLVMKGTSTIDPTQKLKTIDFTPSEGNDKDKLFLGIYELGEKTRKLCFAPSGKTRPTEFSSRAGSEWILVVFERDAAEAVTIERRRMEGVWRVAGLEIDGNRAMDGDARKLTVIIGADGSWSLNAEDKDVAQGTSLIDPSKTPKTIDFTTTVGTDAGKQSLGIYEVGDNDLKFCVGPSGQSRPTEFSSPSGSQRILLTFERVKK